ncbi:MAG: hypothetical protein AB7E95_03240 [Kiritimatiellales bacterium]
MSAIYRMSCRHTLMVRLDHGCGLHQEKRTAGNGKGRVTFEIFRLDAADMHRRHSCPTIPSSLFGPIY